MTTRNVIFAIMCVLLVLVIVMTGIVISKVSNMFRTPPAPKPTTAPTEGTQVTDPTIVTPTETPTQPTEAPPTETPTDPTEHTHSLETTYSKSSTCTSEGYTIKKCSCGKTEIVYTNPKGHSYGAGQIIAPTCTVSGHTIRTCTRCNESLLSDETDALGHDLSIIEEVPAACTVDAHTIKRCSREGCTEAQIDYILGTSLGGHDFSIAGESVPPTCTEDGYTIRKCANEGCTTEERTDLPATGHSFDHWTDTPDGDQESICSNDNCGVSITASQLCITAEGAADLDGYKHYIIEVGTATIQKLYIYEIEDHLMNGSLSYRYDPAQGLIITYTDAEGAPATHTLPLHSGGALVIEGVQEPVAPTDPSEPAPTEPTSTEPETVTEPAA